MNAPRRGSSSCLPALTIAVEVAADEEPTTDRRDEDGQGMVEYALILVLIAVVVIIILSVVGAQVNNVFSNVSSGLGT
jgi:pilus assembly protein Flp/PilA